MNNLSKLQIIFENLSKEDAIILSETIKYIGIKHQKNIKEISMQDLNQEEVEA